MLWKWKMPGEKDDPVCTKCGHQLENTTGPNANGETDKAKGGEKEMAESPSMESGSGQGKRRKAGNMTHEQRVILVDFINRNPRMVTGKFGPDFTMRQNQQLWQEVTETLNAMPGSRKAWQQWRKAWQDLKSKLKKEALTTGGEPSVQPMDADEDSQACGWMHPEASNSGDPNIGPESEVIDYGVIESNENPNELHVPDTDAVYICKVVTQSPSENESEDAQGSPNAGIHQKAEGMVDQYVTPSFAEATTANVEDGKPPGRKRRSRSPASCSSSNLRSYARQELDVRRRYYQQKLRLYERMASAFEKIATALEK